MAILWCGIPAVPLQPHGAACRRPPSRALQPCSPPLPAHCSPCQPPCAMLLLQTRASPITTRCWPTSRTSRRGGPHRWVGVEARAITAQLPTARAQVAWRAQRHPAALPHTAKPCTPVTGRCMPSPPQVPIYDFKESRRVGYRTVEVPESRVVILEGIYALNARLRPQVSCAGHALPIRHGGGAVPELPHGAEACGAVAAGISGRTACGGPLCNRCGLAACSASRDQPLLPPLVPLPCSWTCGCPSPAACTLTWSSACCATSTAPARRPRKSSSR